MVRGRDYIIYTASDPDACFLIDYLLDKGFIVPSSDLGESAMVLVCFTTKRKLEKALSDSGRDTKRWKIREVEKEDSKL